MVSKSKDYQDRGWKLVTSREVTAALVQLLMAPFPEPEHASPAFSIYILPPAVHQVVLEENTSTFLWYSHTAALCCRSTLCQLTDHPIVPAVTLFISCRPCHSFVTMPPSMFTACAAILGCFCHAVLI